MTYHVTIRDKNGALRATVAEHPGLSATGDTLSDVLERLAAGLRRVETPSTAAPSAAANVHVTKHGGYPSTAPCGRVVYGNGGPARHQRGCRTCLERDGAYLPQSTLAALSAQVTARGGDSRLLMTMQAEWKRTEGARQLATLEAAEKTRLARLGVRSNGTRPSR